MTKEICRLSANPNSLTGKGLRGCVCCCEVIKENLFCTRELFLAYLRIGGIINSLKAGIIENGERVGGYRAGSFRFYFGTS